MGWVILNYDLGLKGDYENLYKTLDNLEAIDCGNSNCTFDFKYSISCNNHEDRFKELKKYFENEVDLKKGDRIYAVVLDSNEIARGRFLFGNRQRPIWEGYGSKDDKDLLPF